MITDSKRHSKSGQAPNVSPSVARSAPKRTKPLITRTKPHRESYRPDVPLRKMTGRQILAWASREMKAAERRASKGTSPTVGTGQ